MELNNSITDIPGILVGQVQDEDALTGCSVILCEGGAVAGVDQRGGAPGTRETDALRPMHLVDKIHAVLLAGGSAYGLDAASGVMRYLEEHGLGYDTGVAVVPVVPAAILFDLAIGRADIRPDAAMGYAACQNASSQPPLEGCAGAGMGATVGKILGMTQAVKAGIGSSCIHVGGDLLVGALVVVNAVGDVVDPDTGAIIAGVREPGTDAYLGTIRALKSFAEIPNFRFPGPQNTVIGVIATNARLDKSQANKLAQMGHDGIGRAIRPAHTLMDGDTLFALATGAVQADFNIVSAFAAEAVVQAIQRAVLNAHPAGGLPSAGRSA
jgi:L-aminopeptidase/D-esterase-like protein